MPPNSAAEHEQCPPPTGAVKTARGRPYKYKGTEIKWVNSIAIIVFHVVGVYAFIFHFWTRTPWPTFIFSFILGGIGGFGVTAGAHRLWTHRSYKAKLPLRIFLLFCFAMSGQLNDGYQALIWRHNELVDKYRIQSYDWVRDHRVHHKYSETDADPHNLKRGFFFAHVGWLMLHKHPEVISKGSTMDMSDILADPVARFHERFFIPMKILCCFVLPICLPVYLWNETWTTAILVPGVARYMLNLNFTWLVNSAAHMWGNKPYDSRMAPANSRSVSFFAMGEGWHNYHHVFPWDYKAAELGDYAFNVTTFWIDLFARIGWAYDLKSASPSMVRKVAERYGDGSHLQYAHLPEVPPPGDE